MIQWKFAHKIAAIVWALLLLAFLVGCGAEATATPTPSPTGVGEQTIESITPKEAFELVQNNKDNPNFVILDLRPPERFEEEHIENADNLHYYVTMREFREELDKFDKTKIYLIYCLSGGRSASAKFVFKDLGFAEVYHMLDGIEGWKAEGFPTTK